MTTEQRDAELRKLEALRPGVADNHGPTRVLSIEFAEWIRNRGDDHE